MSIKSTSVSFADIAHQHLSFDRNEESARLILELIDTPWVQRLRKIRQTGYTNLVYMFAEHSRFGHSLGVAYLANMLMNQLARFNPEIVAPYKNAVAAAALLHDIGHLAPGSHVAEKVWGGSELKHEDITIKVITEDPTISKILNSYSPTLQKEVIAILSNDKSLPPWTVSIISGGGWNADRGNWSIVDSAMCCVSYGKYNVLALLDAFRITEKLELALLESRLDALTHFYVARDSMYRQVYQHRVLQSADTLAIHVIKRLRELLTINSDIEKATGFIDQTMMQAVSSSSLSANLPIKTIFCMTESWWNYHIERWAEEADDIIVKDLSRRIRDRDLFKTIKLNNEAKDEQTIVDAKKFAQDLQLNSDYYVSIIDNQDKHRRKKEGVPLILREDNSVITAFEIEPMIKQLQNEAHQERKWLTVPKEIKQRIK